MSNSAAERVPGPTRARGSYWLGKGWDWFVEDVGVYLLVGFLAVLVLTLSQGLFYGPAIALTAAVGLRRVRDGKVDPAAEAPSWTVRLQEDLNATLSAFLPTFLSGLLILLFSAVGLVFLIVPGVVIFSMYLFTFHFILDQGQDFWQAMESSRRLVARDYFGFSVFTLLLVGINLLGILFFFIGSIFTIMISMLAVTAAYRDCQGTEPEPEPAQLPAAPIVIE